MKQSSNNQSKLLQMSELRLKQIKKQGSHSSLLINTLVINPFNKIMKYTLNIIKDPNNTPLNQIQQQLQVLPFTNPHSRTLIYPQNYSQEMIQNEQEQGLINSTSIRSINIQQRWQNPVTKQLNISMSRRISLILLTQISRVRLFSPYKYEAIASLKAALRLWRIRTQRKNTMGILSKISNFRILCFLRVILHKFYKLSIQKLFKRWKIRAYLSIQKSLMKQISQKREPYDIDSQVIRTQASINSILEQNLHSFYNACRFSFKLEGVFAFENALQKIKRNIAYRAFFIYSRNSKNYNQFKSIRQFQAAQSVLRQQIQILESQVENSQLMQVDLHEEITSLSAYSPCGDCHMMRQRLLENEGWQIDHQRLNQVINSNNNSSKKQRVIMIDSDLPFQQYYYNNQFNRQTKSSLDGQFVINSDSEIFHNNMILEQNDQNLSSILSDHQQQLLQQHPYLLISNSHSNTASKRKKLLIDIQANQIPNSKGNKHPQSSGGIFQNSKHIIGQQLKQSHQQSLSSSSSTSLKNQQISNQQNFQQRNKIGLKGNKFTPRVGDPFHNLATMTSSTSSQQKQNIQFSPGIIRPISTCIVGEEEEDELAIRIQNERRDFENKQSHLTDYQPVIAWEQHRQDSRKKRVIIDSSDIDNVISDGCKEQELITEESQQRLSIAAMSEAFQGDGVGLASGVLGGGQNDLGRELMTFVQQQVSQSQNNVQQNEQLKKMLDEENEDNIDSFFKDDEEFISLQGKLIQLEKEVKSDKNLNQ